MIVGCSVMSMMATRSSLRVCNRWKKQGDIFVSKCWLGTTSTTSSRPRRRKRPQGMTRYDSPSDNTSSTTTTQHENDSMLGSKKHESSSSSSDWKSQSIVARDTFIGSSTKNDSRMTMNNNNNSSMLLSSSDLFVPTIEGREVSMEEYLKQSDLLSPWVPCPEAVGRKMLELAELTAEDVHYDLGCGDGRVNFLALASGVKKTVGIDLDASMIQNCYTKLQQKFHPIPTNNNKIAFHAQNVLDPTLLTQMNSDDHPCTVVTLYFVPSAIEQIQKPLLEQLKHVRSIVSCGYPIPGWDPVWVEIILGLPIYSYRKFDNNTQQHNNDDNHDHIDDDVPESNELAYAMVRAQEEMEDEFNPFIQPSSKIKQQQQEEALRQQEQDDLEKIDYHWDDFDDDDDEEDDDDTKRENKV